MLLLILWIIAGLYSIKLWTSTFHELSFNDDKDIGLMFILIILGPISSLGIFTLYSLNIDGSTAVQRVNDWLNNR